MKQICDMYQKKQRPVKVIQFGDGVFLRGFFDWMLQILNDQGLFDGGAVVVKPTASQGRTEEFAGQKFLYTNLIRDLEGQERQIVDVLDRVVRPYEDFAGFLALAELPEARFILSNTTEAGISFCPDDSFRDEPPSSFPAKLTRLLYRRYSLGMEGFWILPCELIEQNGDRLRELVLQYGALWGLGETFAQWVTERNRFCNTLVDRIVSGFVQDAALPYQDSFCNGAESFHFWAIEGGQGLFSELPLNRAGLNVVLTDDLTPYREQKVRILNGAHTAMACLGLKLGLETVEDCMKNKEVVSFVTGYVEQEVLDTVPLPRRQCEEFWQAAQRRFQNPYLRHALSAISLNSVSKFRVRILPVILDLERQGRKATQGLRAWRHLIDWYKTGTPRDSGEAIRRIRQGSLESILSDASLWGSDYSRFAREMEELGDKKGRRLQ